MNDFFDKKPAEVYDKMTELNAGVAKVTLNGSAKNDSPYFAVIYVSGHAECAEILAAVEAVENRWELKHQ